MPGRLLRRPGPPRVVAGFRGVQIDDELLAPVLHRNAPLLLLHEGMLHAEGPVWHDDRLYWSDVANRRLLCLQGDGRVEVAIDGTAFMNGIPPHGRHALPTAAAGTDRPRPPLRPVR